MITWQYSRAMVPPQTTQRLSPRNTSLWSIPVLNAVVVDIFDISRSSQQYPRGGAFGVRGSGNADMSMIADALTVGFILGGGKG